MKRVTTLPTSRPAGTTIGVLVLATLAALATSGRCFGADEFAELVNKIPRSANAVVLLNMDKAKNSPLGLKEDWSAKVEQAFEAGLVRVPPQAKRFVLASQIDFEYMQPMWEAAVIELEEDLSSTDLEKIRHGTLDTIEGLPAVVRPNDTYLIKLGPKLVGAMGPANRQAVVRWIRETRKATPPPLSPYLEKAAVYSDEAGSEIIMALDLEGVFSYQRISKYLKSKDEQLKKWEADRADLAKLLDNVQGVRIGVRIGEKPSAKAVIDVRGDASFVAPYAKQLFTQIMSDRGMAINDVYSWTGTAKNREISLAGTLSKNGLRRLMSVIDSPTADTSEADAQVSPGELPAMQAKASLKHYQAVARTLDNVKSDMRDIKTLTSAAVWYDRYAKRIDKLPILNVDPELVAYSAFIASQFRQAAASVRNMGVQSGVRQAEISTSGSGSADYGYGGYRYGGYGAYGGYDRYADAKAVAGEKRIVRAEEKATMATDVGQIRESIIAATADIRRKMTLKYQIEF
jgi:hypothetical protein